MAKQSFVHGAIVLVASSLITRVLGMVYRIFLARLIGPEGMGLFQMVFPLIGLAINLVLAGLPNAVSKLVAESIVAGNHKRIRRIMIVTSTSIITSAILFTVLLYWLSPWITHRILADPRAYYTLISTIPVILIVAFSSIFRGYFQGMQNMTPIAVSNIIETIVRIGSVWFLAAYFMRYGLAFAAAAAGIGMVAGEVFGLIFLMLRFYGRSRSRVRRYQSTSSHTVGEPFRKTLYDIGEIAVPVTFSRIVGSLGWWGESVLVPRCLRWAGFSAAAATSLFGQYASMAYQLLVFPTVFTSSLTTTLIPAIAEAVAEKRMVTISRRLYQSFRVTALIGLPISAVLTIFAIPLCQVIYNDAGVAPILVVMAPFGFFYYFNGPLSGILQGLNKAGLLMFHSIIGTIVRLGLIFLLARQPHLHIIGVAIAFSVSSAVLALLNFMAVYRFVGFYFHIAETVKLIMSTIILSGILIELRQTNLGLGVTGNLIASLTIGFVVYVLLLLMCRVITVSDFERIPRVGPILAQLARCVPFAK